MALRLRGSPHQGGELTSIALKACGDTEHFIFTSEAVMLPGAPLARCDASRFPIQSFAMCASGVLATLTFLRAASASSPSETPAALMKLDELCPNLQELHLVSGVTGDLEVPAVLSSLANSKVFAQLAVLTLTQVIELPAEADRAAIAWRRSRGDQVELRLQVISQAELDRL